MPRSFKRDLKRAWTPPKKNVKLFFTTFRLDNSATQCKYMLFIILTTMFALVQSLFYAIKKAVRAY